MANVLLALDDAGEGVQLADQMEAAGHRVRWVNLEAAQPASHAGVEAVVLDADELRAKLPAVVDGWRQLDPPPALVVLAGTPAGQMAAHNLGLRRVGKPVVVVLINGRPLAAVDVARQANALIEAWYPGQEGGTAMADVLFGKVNPGGKLPVTIARSVGQLPMFYNAKPSARRGYLFDTTEPLFPFGYGLSYTRFELGAPDRPLLLGRDPSE